MFSTKFKVSASSLVRGPAKVALVHTNVCNNAHITRQLKISPYNLRLSPSIASPLVVRSTSAEQPFVAEPSPSVPYSIINFYWLTDVADPEATVEAHKKFVQENQLDLLGRIYISHQGINAQYSGPSEQAVAYAQWVGTQPGFEGLFFSADPVEGHQFPKLRLKYKKSLISMRGGTLQYNITDPKARATPLEPEQWKQMIGEAKQVILSKRAASGQGASTSGRPAPSPSAPGDSNSSNGKDYVILDLRNDYEWDAGHFEGADRPVEDEFAQTPTDGSLPAYLEGKDPRTTNVMMYCTGGIRCDIYSAYLKEKGFNNVYTLERGIANYFRKEGGEHWKGSMFVFDARMAVSPSADLDLFTGKDLPAAVPCQLCNAADAELPHVNCGNVDCNKLFIACPACKDRLKGCCCEACIDAPRLLRPPKVSGNYGTWTQYVAGQDRQLVDMKIATGRKRTVKQTELPARESESGAVVEASTANIGATA